MVMTHGRIFVFWFCEDVYRELSPDHRGWLLCRLIVSHSLVNRVDCGVFTAVQAKSTEFIRLIMLNSNH